MRFNIAVLRKKQPVISLAIGITQKPVVGHTFGQRIPNARDLLRRKITPILNNGEYDFILRNSRNIPGQILDVDLLIFGPILREQR